MTVWKGPPLFGVAEALPMPNVRAAAYQLKSLKQQQGNNLKKNQPFVIFEDNVTHNEDAIEEDTPSVTRSYERWGSYEKEGSPAGLVNDFHKPTRLYVSTNTRLSNFCEHGMSKYNTGAQNEMRRRTICIPSDTTACSIHPRPQQYQNKTSTLTCSGQDKLQARSLFVIRRTRRVPLDTTLRPLQAPNLLVDKPGLPTGKENIPLSGKPALRPQHSTRSVCREALGSKKQPVVFRSLHWEHTGEHTAGVTQKPKPDTHPLVQEVHHICVALYRHQQLIR